MQVSRLGNPLVNEVLIPLGRKDHWNASDPRNDSQFASRYTDPELAGLVNFLYPVLDNAPTSGRGDLVAVLLTGVPTLNFTGTTQADLLRLNTNFTAPPVGTALGQHGVNIMEFCRQYNEQTQQYAGQVIPVELTIYEDRSFTFVTKQPPAAELIKQAVGIEKGSGEPNRDKVASINEGQLRTIAERKMADLNANDVEAAMKIIAGTARSMGVEVAP